MWPVAVLKLGYAGFNWDCVCVCMCIHANYADPGKSTEWRNIIILRTVHNGNVFRWFITILIHKARLHHLLQTKNTKSKQFTLKISMGGVQTRIKLLWKCLNKLSLYTFQIRALKETRTHRMSSKKSKWRSYSSFHIFPPSRSLSLADWAISAEAFRLTPFAFGYFSPNKQFKQSGSSQMKKLFPASCRD